MRRQNFSGRRMEMVAPTILYRLVCGHAAKGPATLVSGMLRCPKHHKPEIITGVIVREWRAKCHDCNFARWTGMSKDMAKIAANGHYRRNPTHNIEALKMDNPDAQRTAEKMHRYGVAMGTE